MDERWLGLTIMVTTPQCDGLAVMSVGSREASTAPGSPTGRILVTGATGDIGAHLVEVLRTRTAPFAVMCRRAEQRHAFTERGVEAVAGDFADPASMDVAFEGFDQVFLLAPQVANQFDLDRAAIDAASRVGVGHVLKISTADANPDSEIPWARDHARADAHLASSGMRWTRLAPGAFTKNLLQLAPAVRRGVLPGTSGHGATTWVDTRDIAEAAARILDSAELQGDEAGRSYLLTGTHPLSFPQVADIMTEELGRRVRYLHLPGPLMYAGVRASGVPHWEARGLVHQFVDVVRRGADHGRVYSPELRELLCRQPRDVQALISQHREAFRPADHQGERRG